MYHARWERVISDLQSEFDRLNQVTDDGDRLADHSRPLEAVEDRLAELSERGAEILNRWADTDRRYSQALTEMEARLAEWGAIENRLQQDSLERIRSFEGSIEQEWKTLREMHEEPLKQLREQATALSETCMAAANLSLRGYERAEVRLAALEADLRGQLSQLTSDVRAAVSAVQRTAPPPPAIGAGAAPFPLDSVLRIHEELREPREAAPTALARVDVVESARVSREDVLPPPLPPVESSALAERMESLEHQVSSGMLEAHETAARADRMRRDARIGFAAIAVLVLVVAAFGWSLITVRLNEASTRAAAAERQAAAASETAEREIAAARLESERQAAAAVEAATKAALLGDVFAAPDLLRFNLSGVGPAEGAYGQLMWSRTRGLVLSAGRVPAVGPNSTYQIWLLSNGSPIGAGAFTPDASGRATLAVENPPGLPRPINGVTVTIEPAGSTSAAPTGTTALVRPVQ